MRATSAFTKSWTEAMIYAPQIVGSGERDGEQKQTLVEP